MYRIGDFSIISRVSIKMLRHYDEIGLFKPAHIDRFTSYRYYSLDQLPRLNRIMALKSMGFSLSEIDEMLSQPLSTDELQTYAEQKRQDLQQELAAIEEKMTHLKNWVRRIELENNMPEYEIVLKPLVEDATAAAIPTVSEIEVRIPLPTRAGLETDVVFSQQEIPIANALACTVHVGEAETLVQAYIALDDWIRAHGYRIVGTPREVMLQEDAANPQMNMTEIQLPIHTAS